MAATPQDPSGIQKTAHEADAPQLITEDSTDEVGEERVEYEKVGPRLADPRTEMDDDDEENETSINRRDELESEGVTGNRAHRPDEPSSRTEVQPSIE